MPKPDLPSETSDAIIDLLFDADEQPPEEALATLTTAWDMLPEPKTGWDYEPDRIAEKACNITIEQPDLAAAAVWVQRLEEALSPPENPNQERDIEIQKAKLMYRAGHKDIAWALFDKHYQLQGKHAFESTETPAEYFDFYMTYLPEGATPTTAYPIPGLGTGEPSGLVLPDTIHQRLTTLYDHGINNLNLGAPHEAAQNFIDGIELLPEPRDQWEAATQFYGCLADALIDMDYWAEAHQALNYAMQCPGAPGNAYLWLRLGDTYRHLNQPDNALEAYTSAYMLDGEDVFEDEPDAWTTLKHAGIPTT